MTERVHGHVTRAVFLSLGKIPSNFCYRLHESFVLVIMPPKNPQFSRDAEMRLAFEVQQRPILWAVTSPLYKRADLKPLAWAEIVSAMGSPFTRKLIVLCYFRMYSRFERLIYGFFSLFFFFFVEVNSFRIIKVMYVEQEVMFCNYWLSLQLTCK